MQGKLLSKIVKSGIDYKPSDFKAEVHFLGQIIGASDIIEGDGIFLEIFFEAGEKWKCLSQNQTIQTQTGYPNVENFACFSHPFDLHYTTDNLYGWPRIIARVWKLDETNKIDLLSYGCLTLPNSCGFHELQFDSWILQGNLTQETLGYFLNTKPMMNTSDPVSSNLEHRKWLITKPGPKIHINVEVILRNFTFHSLSGVDEGKKAENK